MKVIKSPEVYNEPTNATTIFLAGSIELGRAIDWQKKAAELLKDAEVILFNPRRDKWDWEIKQSITSRRFKEQVTWELNHLDIADYVLFFFDKNTQSPISLLELGLISGSSPQKAIVVCPDGFYRKGNVDIVCERFEVVQYDTLEDAVEYIKSIV
jgi:nucleoside 2-deoxyribosyltransferase-like protein